MEQTETVRNRSNMTIYDLLKQDHKDVKKLFKEIVDNNRYQDNIYMQVKKALEVHMAGEEKVFYSRLENNMDTRELVLESFEEHDLGKKVIKDIDSSAAEDAKLAKVKVLSAAFDQHIRQEEGDLFKKAKKVLSSDDEHEIGRLFENEKMAKMQGRNVT